jgi:catechol 2,3-dioxygenase-like lactoylglutathione lyase family enzyme
VLADASFIGFIPVRDLAAARSFYAGTLGLRVVDDTPFALVLDAGGTMLRVTPVTELAARPFTIAGWQVPDIGAAVSALAGHGVQFVRYDGMAHDDLGIWTAPSGDRIAWFTDPDGNTLSLTTFALTTGVAPIANLGATDGQRVPPRQRSERRRDPRSTSRSGPRAPRPAPGER